MFSGGLKRDEWHEMGSLIHANLYHNFCMLYIVSFVAQYGFFN